jgi:hypothetical protein
LLIEEAMPDKAGEIDSSIAELTHLTTSGVLGFYTHFEATEVFGYRKGEPPINVFPDYA